MELQSPLIYDPRSITRELAAGIILPSDQYSSVLCNFPGNNCIPEWQAHGDFFVSCSVYNNGKSIGVAHTRHCFETGYLEVNFDELIGLSDKPVSGVLIIELCHSAKVPVDLYVAHIHRKTGTYAAYPAGTFIGDKIFTETHAREMENTLFWPGVISNDHSQMCLGVMNPYKLSFSYQLSLFPPNRPSLKSKIFKVQPFKYHLHYLEEEFPMLKELTLDEQTQTSVCIGAQYKLKALILIENRETKAFTTMDHLHTYCIY